MDKILCLQFNNMYNKKVKKVDNISDYYANSANWKIINLNNFLPGDGIVTSDTWNWDEEWFPDYIVHYDTEDDLTVYPSNMNYIERIRVKWSDLNINPDAYEEYTLAECPYVDLETKTVNLQDWNNELAGRYNWQEERLLSVEFFCTPFPSKQFSVIMKDVVLGTGISNGGSDILIGEASYTEVKLNGDDFGVSDEAMTSTILIGEEEVHGSTVFYRLPSTIQFIDYSNDIKPKDRWYVVHSERTRAGQYKFQFYRDLLVDHYDELINQTAFIEKGYVNPNNDLIYNKEGFSFNQIKVDEIPLKDKTETPWIVGYVPFDLESKTGSFSPIRNEGDVIATYSGLSTDWEFNGRQRAVISVDNWGWFISALKTANKKKNQRLGWDFVNDADYGSSINNGLRGPIISQFSKQGGNNGADYYSRFEEVDTIVTKYWFSSNGLAQLLNQQLGGINKAQLDQLLAWDGKKVVFDDGTYYIRAKTENIITYKDDTAYKLNNNSDPVVQYMETVIKNRLAEALKLEQISYSGYSALDGHLDYKAHTVNITLEPVPITAEEVKYKWSLPNSSRRLKDNPYKMFAIPLSGIKMNFDGNILDTSEIINLEAAINISRSLVTNQEIYDLQILPYCPVPNLYRNSSGVLEMPSSFQFGLDYTYITWGTGDTIKEEDEYKSVMIFPEESSFSFDIQQSIPVDNVKIENETTFYRICSPNYAAGFDFNVAMNRGINTWKVYCTYKPYSPYIQISPLFDGLYGRNFDDFRGLVCAGDFSLPLVDDAWTTYELNNKNYQNMFDRQIQNMETMNELALKQAKWQAATGTISGASSGAATGAIASGGAVGAIVGGAVGAVTSLAGGIADVEILKKQQAETMSYTRSTILYQLQNIQALPTTLSRITSLTAVYKFYPFIEKYTCTDVERKAFEDYLKYNGMTINVIGNINDYIGPEETYIKAQLIRLEESTLDYHELVEAAKVLKEGVYI